MILRKFVYKNRNFGKRSSMILIDGWIIIKERIEKLSPTVFFNRSRLKIKEGEDEGMRGTLLRVQFYCFVERLSRDQKAMRKRRAEWAWRIAGATCSTGGWQKIHDSLLAIAVQRVLRSLLMLAAVVALNMIHVAMRHDPCCCARPSVSRLQLHLHCSNSDPNQRLNYSRYTENGEMIFSPLPLIRFDPRSNSFSLFF